MTECSVVITGYVQGVFYRQSTKEKAQELGVFGWVKNCPDGSVKAMFQGEDVHVEAMVSWCWDGPENARVDHVSILYSKPCTDVRDRFTIQR